MTSKVQESKDDIVTAWQIEPTLRNFAEEYSLDVRHKLKRSDVVWAGFTGRKIDEDIDSENEHSGIESYEYVIDDPNVVLNDPKVKQALKRGHSTHMLYELIRSHLAYSIKGADNLFEKETQNKEGNVRVPFSSAWNNGVGVCFEKAIATQLLAQKWYDCYLVCGELKLDEGGGGGHAWNILFESGVPYLVDAQNPVLVDGRIRVYSPPILGARIQDRRHIVFDVPQSQRFGRTYVFN